MDFWLVQGYKHNGQAHEIWVARRFKQFQTIVLKYFRYKLFGYENTGSIEMDFDYFLVS